MRTPVSFQCKQFQNSSDKVASHTKIFNIIIFFCIASTKSNKVVVQIRGFPRELDSLRNFITMHKTWDFLAINVSQDTVVFQFSNARSSMLVFSGLRISSCNVNNITWHEIGKEGIVLFQLEQVLMKGNNIFSESS